MITHRAVAKPQRLNPMKIENRSNGPFGASLLKKTNECLVTSWVNGGWGGGGLVYNLGI